MKVSEKDLSSMFAEAGLRLQPPLVRNAVFNDADFLSQFGLIAQEAIHFSDLNSSFPSSNFYEAYRSLESGKVDVEIEDDLGRKWQVRMDDSDNGWPVMILTNQESELKIRDLFPIGENAKSRTSCLKRLSDEIYISHESIQIWEGILTERPVTDSELKQWHRVVQSAPQSVERDIRREFSREGKCTIDTLLPSQERYFEQLVGKYDGSVSIHAYAKSTWAAHCRSVNEWNPYFGFLQNLYSAGHSSIVREIPTPFLSLQDLVRAFQFIEEEGDLVSKIGAIELGMRIVGERPQVGSFVYRLIEQIRDDNTESNCSEFFVLSSLFEFVDGSLSSRGVFRDTPPFYRRLASLAHASLLQRQLHQGNIDAGRVADWTKQFGNMQFHCQSLTDMRVEPRWIPPFSTPEQLRAEFLGRIVNGASLYKEAIQDTEIFDLVMGDCVGSILTICDTWRLFLPGPLEGDRESAPQPPKHFTDAIDAQLRSGQPVSSSFAALVNGSLLFRLEASQADTAATLLFEGKQRIRELSNKKDLIDILNGLALAAAVSESESLRDQVFVLTRRYRRDPEFSLTCREAISICHMASAADQELDSWCGTVCNWMTDFAFSELTDVESSELFSYLETLLRIEPVLWCGCGRAHAALQSIQKTRVG